jgi:hypothetical protein
MAQYISDAIKSGYEAGTAISEDIASGQTLKSAYEQAGKETDEAGNVKPVDMFKVNTLAAQMAAKRGDERLADKFNKKAEDTKKSEIANQLDELKLGQNQLEAFEQQVQMLDSPQKALDVAMTSNLPTQQKLAIIDQLKQVGNDPKKFEELKDKFQKSIMTAKERLTAEQKTLQMKQHHEEKLMDQKIRLEGIRTNANLREKGLDLKEREIEERQRHNEVTENLKSFDSATKVDDAAAKQIKTLTRGKDPEEAAKITKQVRKLAEDRKRELRTGGGGKEPKETQEAPQEHIDWLLKNDTPANRKSFDSKYGNGSAAEYIARSKQ